MTHVHKPGLVRIIYRSQSGLDGTASEIAASLDAILRTAQVRNEQAGVTGALMFTQLMFIQVLEGSSEAVEAAFERISRDLRHRAVEVVEYGEVEERGFGAWSMRHLVPEANAEMIIDRVAAEDATEGARVALTLMRALLRAADATAKQRVVTAA